MRVGLLCHSGIGGSVRIACALAGELARRGHDAHLIARRPPVSGWLTDPVAVHALRPAANGGPPLELELGWRNGERSEFSSLIADVVRTERLQVLHAHYAVPFAHLAASLGHRLGESGPVTIATLHGTDVSVQGRRPVERRLLTESLRALDGVTTVSRDHARLSRHLFGLREPPTLIPNFIDLAGFKPREAPHGGRPRIAHISNFRAVKDPRSLARVYLAVRERIDAELWLIGDGPRLPALRRMLDANGAGGAVRFFGATTEVSAILREADALLMTSVAESFCLAAVEAMACGVPVVATRVGGIAEVVGDDGTAGRLFPVGAHAQAAEAVVELLTRRSLRQTMGGAARRRAARFSPDRVVPLYEGLYRDLRDRREGGAIAVPAAGESL